MAITIRSVTVGTNDGTSATVSVTTSETPSATQPGDLVVVVHGNDFYALSNMPTPTATGSPTLTSAVDADAGTNQAHLKSYTYVVNTGGAQTISVTETGSHDEEKQITAIVLGGADTSTPLDGTASAFSATAQLSQVAAAISPGTADALMIVVNNAGGGSATASYTVPGSMTEQTEIHVGGLSGVVATEQLSASGSTGTRTVTAANSIPWGAVTIGIRAAVGVAEPLIPQRVFLPRHLLFEWMAATVARTVIVGPTLPSDIPGLAGWWKADSLGLSDGAAVSSWTDSSGGGHTATQDTGSLQPIYKTSIVNGQPVVRFDGAGDYLLATIVSDAQPSQWFLVFKAADSGVIRYLVGTGQGILRHSSSDLMLINAPTDVWGTYTHSGAAWSMFAATFNGASSRQYMDGDAGQAMSTPGTNATGTTFIMGADGGFANTWNGDIAEIIHYSRELTADERANVHTYLATKYGLAAAATVTAVTVNAVAAIPAVTMQVFPATVTAVAQVPAASAWGAAPTAPVFRLRQTAGGSRLRSGDVIRGIPATAATPATVAATATVPAATIKAGSAPAPATVAAVAAVAPVTVRISAAVNPTVVTTAATIPGPTVATGSTISPVVVAAVATIPTPGVGGSTAATPGTVAAVASVPAATVAAGGTVTPAVVAATAAIPAPTIRLSVAISPAVVAVVASIGAVTVKTGGTATPVAVAVAAAILTPTVTGSAGATATPATVNAAAAAGAPTVRISTAIVPAVVQVVAAIPGPAVRAASTVSAVTVAVLASVPERTLAGDVIFRPNTGLIIRPATGTTSRPYTGVTTRP